jgi:hypothetical protein
MGSRLAVFLLGLAVQLAAPPQALAQRGGMGSGNPGHASGSIFGRGGGDSGGKKFAERCRTIGIGFLAMLFPIPIWLVLFFHVGWGFIGSTLAVGALVVGGFILWMSHAPSDGRVARPRYVGKNHGPRL